MLNSGVVLVTFLGEFSRASLSLSAYFWSSFGRHRIRDCNSIPDLKERIKIFEEFVCLFEYPDVEER
jgi:hypothetical protein